MTRIVKLRSTTFGFSQAINVGSLWLAATCHLKLLLYYYPQIKFPLYSLILLTETFPSSPGTSQDNITVNLDIMDRLRMEIPLKWTNFCLPRMHLTCKTFLYNRNAAIMDKISLPLRVHYSEILLYTQELSTSFSMPGLLRNCACHYLSPYELFNRVVMLRHENCLVSSHL